jgi:hypothetical protein
MCFSARGHTTVRCQQGATTMGTQTQLLESMIELFATFKDRLPEKGLM